MTDLATPGFALSNNDIPLLFCLLCICYGVGQQSEFCNTFAQQNHFKHCNYYWKNTCSVNSHIAVQQCHKGGDANRHFRIVHKRGSTIADQILLPENVRYANPILKIINLVGFFITNFKLAVLKNQLKRYKKIIAEYSSSILLVVTYQHNMQMSRTSFRHLRLHKEKVHKEKMWDIMVQDWRVADVTGMESSFKEVEALKSQQEVKKLKYKDTKIGKVCVLGPHMK